MERHEEAKPLAWLRPARVTTRQATACKEAQRPQARRQQLNRVCSAVTHKVKWINAEKVNIHRHLLVQISAQLRNLGLTPRPARSAIAALLQGC